MKKVALVFVMLAVLAIPAICQDGETEKSSVIWTILTFVMTAVAGLLGKVSIAIKKKFGKAAIFSKETLDVAMAANDMVQHTKLSLEDDKFDEAEIKGFKTKAAHLGLQVKEMLAAFKDIFQKAPA